MVEPEINKVFRYGCAAPCGLVTVSCNVIPSSEEIREFFLFGGVSRVIKNHIDMFPGEVKKYLEVLRNSNPNAFDDKIFYDFFTPADTYTLDYLPDLTDSVIIGEPIFFSYSRAVPFLKKEFDKYVREYLRRDGDVYSSQEGYEDPVESFNTLHNLFLTNDSLNLFSIDRTINPDERDSKKVFRCLNSMIDQGTVGVTCDFKTGFLHYHLRGKSFDVNA